MRYSICSKRHLTASLEIHWKSKYKTIFMRSHFLSEDFGICFKTYVVIEVFVPCLMQDMVFTTTARLVYERETYKFFLPRKGQEVWQTLKTIWFFKKSFIVCPSMKSGKSVFFKVWNSNSWAKSLLTTISGQFTFPQLYLDFSIG